KDTAKTTLKVGDFVILTVKSDPNFPARGTGFITAINWQAKEANIQVNEEYASIIEGAEAEKGMITRNLDAIDKPLEIFYEQIAKRNATGLAQVENTAVKQQQSFEKFYSQLSQLNFVPAGRVLYGAGSETDVTYFNCYVM